MQSDNEKYYETPTEGGNINNRADDPDYVQSSVSPIFAAVIGLVGVFFLYQIMGSLLIILIFGMDFEKAPINSLRLLTIAGQLLFILLPSLFLAKSFYSDLNKIFRFRLPHLNEFLLFTAGLIILTPMLQVYLYIQNYYFEILAQKVSFLQSIKQLFDYLDNLIEKTYGNLLITSNVLEFLFVVLVVAITPAISEEIMFRGYVQRSFEQKVSPIIASVITAIFFSFYHFNPYGYIPLAFLGFYFGLAAYYSKSLLIPIFLHFLNNFSAVAIYHIIGSEELIKSDVSAESGEIGLFITSFLLLVGLFSALLILVKKYYSSHKIA
jgi:membrane protease YdiL (CAAX protease family)